MTEDRASELPRMKRPCDECPWRLDVASGSFERERWDALRCTSHNERSGSANLGSPMFACHKTPETQERACAGWLAVEGASHVGVRLAVIDRRMPSDALVPGDGWPSLHESFASAAATDLGEEYECWL